MSARLKRRILRGTIWNPFNLVNVQSRYQSIYTTLFPGLYVLFMLYGLASLPAPILSIDALLGPAYGDLWSVMLFCAGLAAFLGQTMRPQRSTPEHGLRLKHRWQQVELAALSLVIVLESLYQVSIFASGFLVPVPDRFTYLASLPWFFQWVGSLPPAIFDFMASTSRIRWLAILALVVYLFPPIWKVRDTVRGMRPAA